MNVTMFIVEASGCHYQLWTDHTRIHGQNLPSAAADQPMTQWPAFPWSIRNSVKLEKDSAVQMMFTPSLNVAFFVSCGTGSTVLQSLRNPAAIDVFLSRVEQLIHATSLKLYLFTENWVNLTVSNLECLLVYHLYFRKCTKRIVSIAKWECIGSHFINCMD